MDAENFAKRISQNATCANRRCGVSIAVAIDCGGSFPALNICVYAAIERHELVLLQSHTFEDAVQMRLDLYRRVAGRKPTKAYINLGGGAVSVGRHIGKKILSPGLNLRPPEHIDAIQGVAPQFAAGGVPVIHLVQIVEMAEKNGLPIAPAPTPEPGEGQISVAERYNLYLTIGVLAVVLAALWRFIRSDVGFRMLKIGKPKPETAHPEPMV